MVSWGFDFEQLIWFAKCRREEVGIFLPLREISKNNTREIVLILKITTAFPGSVGSSKEIDLLHGHA